MLVSVAGLVLGAFVLLSSASPTCPLDGPVFPKPLRLSGNDAVKTAVATLKNRFVNITAGAQNYSMSIQVFSANDPAPLFSLSHTAPSLANQNSTGVKLVDENTVFRLGSLTKIYTIYAFLINAGDSHWNEPITRYIPELQALANRSDPVNYVSWDEITLGGLATQLTGIPREYALLGELTQSKETRGQVLQLGFPPLSQDQKPPCGAFPTCDRAQFFQGIGLFYPSLAPYQTPAYSNVAFQLLGYALETITGKTFQTLLDETVIEPLGLNNTFLRAPEDSRGIIPGDHDKTGWAFDIGESAATGNMYASASDLSALGRAILSHKLLSPVTTRRWLKPFAFSSDPLAMVGMPWGARRIKLDDTYRYTTAFNKAGNIGDYSALLAILPDFDIGISILLAGELPGNAGFSLADIIGDSLLLSVEEAARSEADSLYSGHYVSPDDGLNSSMTITIDKLPGLSISQWFSNGTDFAWVATALQNQYYPVTPRIRLYPSGLEGPAEGGGKRVVFKAMFEDANAPRNENKMFSTECGSWVSVESVIYGSAAMDELIFNLDSSGKVVSVTSPSLRVTLNKE
ncbi:beta-lactamase/transpeptidase-like protein [Annulohypoxylon maeteangense]|uniref:beta-lactamase/transpeptidase-like protein n=1 Tax=Annulohypoxylon maeteangense TaxID=1927788 RepID=UPI002008ACDB|nr:beta-lactamase/transpeptidase-like protein [Annulohypoxylon maeteangense]KAI0889512.1 beta-lactamase/transpeptidase-like protein [Annulohypoxylon maeteangense]